MSHITLNYFAKGPANTLYAVLASLEFLANAQVADAIVSPAAQFIFWHLCNLVRNWYISMCLKILGTTNILDLKSILEMTATSKFCCHDDATDNFGLICLSYKNKYNV